MSAPFPLQTLQHRHPQAFYQRLIFSQLKFTQTYSNPLAWLWFFILAVIFSLPLLLISNLMRLFCNTLHADTQLNLSFLTWISCNYLLLAFATYQARHSSTVYAKYLQKKLHIMVLAAVGIGLNQFSIQSEYMSWLIFMMLCLPCMLSIFIETQFKVDSTAIERIQLHKLRQFAYWAHLESRKKFPQSVSNVTDLKSYYDRLHQAALSAENQLLLDIKEQPHNV